MIGHGLLPEFTTHQKTFWKSSLCKAFIENHSIRSSQNTKPLSQLRAWTDPEIIKKLKFFYSRKEHHIYECYFNHINFYSTIVVCTYIQWFNTTNEVFQSKPALASLLASVDPRSRIIALASKISQNLTLQDKDTIYANYKSGPFDSIEEAFESSVNCKQILIDKYN